MCAKTLEPPSLFLNVPLTSSKAMSCLEDCLRVVCLQFEPFIRYSLASLLTGISPPSQKKLHVKSTLVWSLQEGVLWRVLWGPKSLHTLFVIWEFISQLHRTSVTQGFLAGILCVIRRLHKVLLVNLPVTHINCRGINFPIAHTFVTQKNCFRIIYVIILGLMAVALVTPTPFVDILKHHMAMLRIATTCKGISLPLGESRGVPYEISLNCSALGGFVCSAPMWCDEIFLLFGYDPWIALHPIFLRLF